MTPNPTYNIKRWQSLHEFIYKGVKVLGLSSLIVSYGMFLWTYLSAYFSGAMATTVWINHYNEAHIEFILLLVLFIPTVYMIIKILRQEAKSEATD